MRLPRAIGETVSTENSEKEEDFKLNDLDPFLNELKKHLPIAIVERVQGVFSAMVEAQTEEMEAKAAVSVFIDH